MSSFLKQFYKTIVWTSGLLYLSFAPSSQFGKKLYLFPHQDKVVHIILYMVLAFILIYDINLKSKITTKIVIYSFIALVILGISIEILQPILSNRSRDIFDVGANTIGSVFGFFLFSLYQSSKKKI